MTRAPAQRQARARRRAGDIAALRAACARAVRDPTRIEAVVLFGSLARGNFDGFSDADIAVIGDRAAFDTAVFSGLERSVDVVAIDPARWHATIASTDALSSSDTMMAAIRAEGLPLWP